MCGDACRPDAADASPTICHTRCRVSLCAPRARKSSGEFSRRRRRLASSTSTRQHRPRLRQIFPQRILRRLPQRHNAFLVTLAANQHVSRLKLQVFDFGVDYFRNAQRSRVEHFEHGAVAKRQSRGFLRLRTTCVLRRERSGQRGLHLVARQRLGQHLPLPRRLNVQSWVVIDFLVEQQIPVEMPQRRKLPPHAAPVHLIGKKLLQKFPHIAAPRRQQQPLPLLQKLGKLQDVRGVSADR